MLRSIASYGGWALSIVGIGAFAANNFAPPIGGFTASAWVYDAQHVSAEVGAWDLRPCHYVKGSAVGQAHENGAWWQVDLTVGPHAPPGVPLGWRSFGRWTWGRPEGATPVDSVMATLTLICDSKQTKVDVGPFDVHG